MSEIESFPAKAASLLGRTITKVEYDIATETVLIKTRGKSFRAYHSQSCCECFRFLLVDVPEKFGKVNHAYLQYHQGPEEHSRGSHTITILRIEMDIGTAIHCIGLGESNGYYNESFDFEEVFKE